MYQIISWCIGNGEPIRSDEDVENSPFFGFISRLRVISLPLHCEVGGNEDHSISQGSEVF